MLRVVYFMTDRFDLYVDGKHLAVLDRDQVAELDSLMELRGILVAPVGVRPAQIAAPERVGERA